MFDLNSEAIFNDRCTFCGACAAVCDKINMDEEAGVPKLEEVCRSDDEVCLKICPRQSLDVESIEKSLFGEQRTDAVLGVYKKVVSARSRNSNIVKHAQSGGFVTSLLISALENGIIDAAVVTSSDFTKGENPRAIVVNSKEEIIAASGSKYTPCSTILGLKQAAEEGYQRVGFVGLPCHIEALRNLQTSQFDITFAKNIALVIGLFCSKSFSHNEFMQASKETVGKEKIRKFDMKGKNFFIYTEKDKEYKVPLKNLDEFARNACKLCLDYTAELADISAGSVGSPAGYSSVIVRSEAGLQAFDIAVKKKYIEVQDMEPKDIDKIREQASKKRKLGFQEILSQVSPVKLMHLVLKPKQLRIEPLLE
ncbi:MAG: Coenzyme F420 hydrogenase/dehydrogenase, beta subunit C-terminal domain [Candidatus Hermodarchaeota archaeon]